MYLKQQTIKLRANKLFLPVRQRQRGFVLIMALVLLGVMTLIGVSSMNMSNVELKATSNARQHHLAFNAVHSVLEFSIYGTTNLDFQNIADQTLNTGLMPTLPDVIALAGSSVHAGCTVGVGSSLEEGRGFSYNFFEVTAEGFNSTSGGVRGSSSSSQGLGVRYPAAACD